MNYILDAFIILLLIMIFIQDLKYRAVHVVLILGIFIVSSVIFYKEKDSILNLQTLGYLIGIFLVLWMYLSLKCKTLMNPFENHIGLGDVLFLLSITPLFGLYNFMLFFISGTLLTLIAVVIFQKRLTKHMIPFAGLLSAHLILIKIISISLDQDLFYTQVF